MAALRGIRRLQKSIDLFISKDVFSRVVREILYDVGKKNMNIFGIKNHYRIQRAALAILQKAAEYNITSFFNNKCITQLHYHCKFTIFIHVLSFTDSLLFIIHAKKISIQQEDMGLMKRLMKNLGLMK